MAIAVKQSILEETGRGTMKALLEKLEYDKGYVLSVRLDSGLGKALEQQTKAWKFKSVSDTVRTILSFYFLPVVYQLEWKDKDFRKLLAHNKNNLPSYEYTRANYFLKALLEYMDFIQQSRQTSEEAIVFLNENEKQLNAIIEEMAGRMKQAIKEMEQAQGEL